MTRCQELFSVYFVAEGGGIEPPCLRRPWYSRPVAHHGRRLPRWRRAAESNGHPCGAPVFQAGRDPHPRALQTEWPRAEESNPHPEGAPVLKTGGGPSARARGGAPGENRTHHEQLCRLPLRQLASGANLAPQGSIELPFVALETTYLPKAGAQLGAGSGSRTRIRPLLRRAAIPIR